MYSPPGPLSALQRGGANAFIIKQYPPLYAVERGIKGVSTCDWQGDEVAYFR
jgi:hypothetical protein